MVSTLNNFQLNFWKFCDDPFRIFNRHDFIISTMNFGPDSNFIYSKEAKLYNFKKLSDIKINKRDLYHINYPVLIIHGTNDEVVSVENSKRIITEFPKIQLKVIEGADHSYSSDSVLNQILNDTVNFIK